MEDQLLDFVEWMEEQDDIFYVFDNKRKAIKDFLEQQED